MIAALHGLRNSAASGNERDRDAFAASLRLLGFLSETAAEWKLRKQQASGVDAKQVDGLISERIAARARKDFKESDRIRDQLAAMGVVIKDSKEGTTWEIADDDLEKYEGDRAMRNPTRRFQNTGAITSSSSGP